MTRRIPLSHGAHLTGWHPVRPGHGAVPFESALERDTITWLSQWPGFCRLVAQPVTVEHLHPDGHLAHYTPDLFVVFDPLPGALRARGFGAETYIEVKCALEAERLAERWALLRAAVERQTQRPWVLLTEREVRSTGRPRFRWSSSP
jgi:hypothetical protein